MKFSTILLSVIIGTSSGLVLAHQNHDGDRYNEPRQEYWQKRWPLHAYGAPVWAFKNPRHHEYYEKPRRHEYNERPRHHKKPRHNYW